MPNFFWGGQGGFRVPLEAVGRVLACQIVIYTTLKMPFARSQIDRLLKSRYLRHLLFWITLVVTSVTMSILNQGDPRWNIVNALTLLPSQMITAYLLTYWLVPKYLMRRRFTEFAVLTIGLIFFFAALARLSIIYIAEPLLRDDFIQESVWEVLSDPVYLLMVYVPAIGLFPIIFLAVKSINDRFRARHQLEVLHKSKLENELRFLKAQIHPHFLFNTLNNLYALTVAKSDKAPDALLKLSQMLDFLLYKGDQPFVPIAQEVEILHNYVDLEKLRHGDELSIEFSESIDQKNTPIAPLILLSIVENAFKHGASGTDEKAEIAIDLTVENQKIFFTSYNTKPKSPRQNTARSGIGSKNLKRQLELTYPNAYHLEEFNQPDYFKVLLEIEVPPLNMP